MLDTSDLRSRANVYPGQIYCEMTAAEVNELLDRLQSAVAIPEGMRLVPIEATTAMIDAGVAMALQVTVHGQGGWRKYISGLYSQMLSSAPVNGEVKDSNNH